MGRHMLECKRMMSRTKTHITEVWITVVTGAVKTEELDGLADELEVGVELCIDELELLCEVIDEVEELEGSEEDAEEEDVDDEDDEIVEVEVGVEKGVVEELDEDVSVEVEEAEIGMDEDRPGVREVEEELGVEDGNEDMTSR
jgi:hypothetical protein